MTETATATKWNNGVPFEKEWSGLGGKGEGGITYATVRHKAIQGGWKPKQLAHSVAQIGTPTPARRLMLEGGTLAVQSTPPPPRDYVLEPLIVSGKSAILAGLGGVSKTQLMIQIAAHIALGLPFAGLKVGEGCVILFLGEEDREEIGRRFGAVAADMKLTPEQRAKLEARIRVFPMIGQDMRLTNFASGALEASGFADEIIAVSQDLAAATGVPIRMVVLDHAAMIHGGDFNKREDVAQTMREVNHIAQTTGAAVVALAHSPKATINAEKSSVADVAGNAAWTDMARGAMVLNAMRDEEGKKFGIVPELRSRYVSLNVVKNNYGPTGGAFWFERVAMPPWGVSPLHHIQLTPMPKAPTGNDAKLRERIFELIRSHPMLTKNQLEQKWAGTDGVLKASKAAVRSEVEAMTAEGVLEFRMPTQEERAARGIKGKTSGIFVIST